MLCLPEIRETDAAPLRLPVHCSTVVAEDLRVCLVIAVDNDRCVEIDASEVESVGQAVLQLLLAARAEAEATGCSFTIINPSRAFVVRMVACGLAERFELETERVPQ